MILKMGMLVSRFILIVILIGYANFKSAEAKSCKGSQDDEIGSSLFWSEVPVGYTSFEPCPSGASGNITRDCLDVPGIQTGVWAEPDVTGCANNRMQSLWDQAPQMANNAVASDIINFMDDLGQFTEEAAFNHTLYPVDLHYAVKHLEIIASKSDAISKAQNKIQQFTQSYGDAVSSICDNGTMHAWKNFNDEEVVSREALQIFTAMETMAINIMINPSNKEKNMTAHSKNLNFDITVIAPKSQRTLSNNQRGNMATQMLGENQTEEYRMVSSDGSTTIIYTEQIINISLSAKGLYDPKRAFYRAEYETISYLLGMNVSRNDSTETTSIISSKIVSAEILNINKSYYSNLTLPVKIIFRHNKDSVADASHIGCYFINESARSEQYLWSSTGCEVADINDTHTTCHCYHLTNFALIMDIYKMDLSPVHEKALSYISYIGGSLSIMCCTVSIIIYEVLRIKNERIRVHEMLALSITLSQLTFFVGFERTESKAVCRALAIVLHYLFTCMFCWMLVEGIHIYMSLVKVFRKKNHFKKYLFLGWGIPAVNVMISVAVFLDEYAANEYCWLSVKLLISGFIPIVGLTIIANTVILMLVLRVMIKSLKSRNEDIVAAKTGFKATVILLPLLGLTWVFGFLSVGTDATLIFTYAFTICNSLQGVFFFLFHCLFNADVRKAFERKYMQKKNEHCQMSTNSKDAIVCNLSTLSNHVVEGDSVRRVITFKKRPSSTSTESSGTNQTNVDSSECGSRDEFIPPEDEKWEYITKLEKDKYNMVAQDLEEHYVEKQDKSKKSPNSLSGQYKRKGKGEYKKGRPVTRRDAMRRKPPSTPPVNLKHAINPNAHLERHHAEYMEWVKAHQKRGNESDEYLDIGIDDNFVIHI